MLADAAAAEARVRDAQAGAAGVSTTSKPNLPSTRVQAGSPAACGPNGLGDRRDGGPRGFERLDDATVATLADWVVGQVIGSAGDEG
jgi:hypothetical protein